VLASLRRCRCASMGDYDRRGRHSGTGTPAAKTCNVRDDDE